MWKKVWEEVEGKKEQKLARWNNGSQTFYTLESPRELRKMLMPWPHLRPGWVLDFRYVDRHFPDISNEQLGLRTAVLTGQ